MIGGVLALLLSLGVVGEFVEVGSLKKNLGASMDTSGVRFVDTADFVSPSSFN